MLDDNVVTGWNKLPRDSARWAWEGWGRGWRDPSGWSEQIGADLESGNVVVPWGLSWPSVGGLGWVANHGEQIGLTGAGGFVGAVEAELASLAGIGAAEVEGVDGGDVCVLADQSLGSIVGLLARGDFILGPDGWVNADGGDDGGDEGRGEDGELHFDGGLGL